MLHFFILVAFQATTQHGTNETDACRIAYGLVISCLASQSMASKPPTFFGISLARPSVPGLWAERLAGHGCAVLVSDLLWERARPLAGFFSLSCAAAGAWVRRSVVLLLGGMWSGPLGGGVCCCGLGVVL